MFWKKWPYWIKGGIVGIIVYLVILIPSFLCSFTCFPSGGLNCVGCMLLLLPIDFIARPLRIIPGFEALMTLSIYAYLFAIAVYFFVIGALVKIVSHQLEKLIHKKE